MQYHGSYKYFGYYSSAQNKTDWDSECFQWPQSSSKKRKVVKVGLTTNNCSLYYVASLLAHTDTHTHTHTHTLTHSQTSQLQILWPQLIGLGKGGVSDSRGTNVYRLASGLTRPSDKKGLLRKGDWSWEETTGCFLLECLMLRDTQREAIIWKCEQDPKGTERKVRLQRPRGSWDNK